MLRNVSRLSLLARQFRSCSFASLQESSRSAGMDRPHRAARSANARSLLWFVAKSIGQVVGSVSTGLLLKSDDCSVGVSMISAGGSCGEELVTGAASGETVAESEWGEVGTGGWTVTGAELLKAGEGRSVLANSEGFNDQNPKRASPSTRTPKTVAIAAIFCLGGLKAAEGFSGRLLENLVVDFLALKDISPKQRTVTNQVDQARYAACELPEALEKMFFKEWTIASGDLQAVTDIVAKVFFFQSAKVAARGDPLRELTHLWAV